MYKQKDKQYNIKFKNNYFPKKKFFLLENTVHIKFKSVTACNNDIKIQ